MDEEVEEEELPPRFFENKLVLAAGGVIIIGLLILAAVFYGTPRTVTYVEVDDIVFESSEGDPLQLIGSMTRANRIYVLTEYEGGTSEVNRGMFNASVSVAYLLGTRGKVVLNYGLEFENGNAVQCMAPDMTLLPVEDCLSLQEKNVVIRLLLPGNSEEEKVVVGDNIIELHAQTGGDSLFRETMVVMTQVQRERDEKEGNLDYSGV
jgi:hypothetical protein